MSMFKAIILQALQPHELDRGNRLKTCQRRPFAVKPVLAASEAALTSTIVCRCVRGLRLQSLQRLTQTDLICLPF
jgi:hypothetical protein